MGSGWVGVTCSLLYTNLTTLHYTRMQKSVCQFFQITGDDSGTKNDARTTKNAAPSCLLVNKEDNVQMCPVADMVKHYLFFFFLFTNCWRWPLGLTDAAGNAAAKSNVEAIAPT